MCVQGVTGDPAEHILELCSISVNKNTVPAEHNPRHPSGLRLGEGRRGGEGGGGGEGRLLGFPGAY